MQIGIDALSEVFLHDVFVFVETRFKIGIDNPLIQEVLLNAVVDHFRVVLSADAGEHGFFFRLGNAQLIESAADFFGDVVPVGGQIRVGANIGNDLVHIHFRQIRSPRGVFFFVKNL